MHLKKLLPVFLIAVLCFAVLPGTASGAKTVAVKIPSFDVKLNGTLLNQINDKYPVIIYKDITYFPMTFYHGAYLGISAHFTAKGGLQIKSRNEPSPRYNSYTDRINDINANYQARIVTSAVTVNGKPIDNSKEEYPLLLFRDITYFPLTWKFAVEEFGWDYKFTPGEGLTIVSKNGQKDDAENMLSVLNKAFYQDDYNIKLEFLKPYLPASIKPDFIYYFNVKNIIDGNTLRTVFTPDNKTRGSTISMGSILTWLNEWEWKTNIKLTNYTNYYRERTPAQRRGIGPHVSGDVIKSVTLWELTGSRKENIRSIKKLDVDGNIERYEIKFKDGNQLMKYDRTDPRTDCYVECLSMIVSIDKAENSLALIKYRFTEIWPFFQIAPEFEVDISLKD